MKKWILIGLAAVVVIVVVVVILGISNLGPIIKKAVNTYGPKITKTELRLDDVKVSLLSGETQLKGFYLGNPQGFAAPEAMRVGSIYVDVNEKSVTGDPIVIEKIEVKTPEITYEKARGTDNFKTIVANVKQSVGGKETGKPEASQEGGGRKLIINELTMTGGKVSLASTMVKGKTIQTNLPDIRLTDIGKKSNGATAAEVAQQVAAAIYEKIQSPAVIGALKDQLKAQGLNVEVLEGATQQLKAIQEKSGEQVKGVTDRVKGLMGK